MKLMLDCSPRKIKEYSTKYGHDFWQLRTPLTQYALSGKPYGLDNGCFSGFDQGVWDTLLEEALYTEPVFVCLPDIVGDALRTLELFDLFKDRTEHVPRALVIQDGIENHRIPWNDLEAVFVGGSTVFKSSPAAMNVCKTAKLLGKWIHVGRVNTYSRAVQWVDIADSTDGSGVSKFDDRIEAVLEAFLDHTPLQRLVAKRLSEKDC